MSDTAWNMYIFRDGKVKVRGRELMEALGGEIEALSGVEISAHRTQLLSALLRAGELECALADDGSDHASQMASVTDALASALMDVHGQVTLAHMRDVVSDIPAPETVGIAPPEGFAYYALHPFDYVKLLEHVPLPPAGAAVIGIRSIGTTLSAVVAAGLQARGVPAQRITVRPCGHPYDRHTSFSVEQLEWIAGHRARDADFLVVDEGPGMSGSSFLSVGDALLAAGVPRSNIAFLCSRMPDPSSLKAQDAARRWTGFRSYYVAPNSMVPSAAKLYIGGGIWRQYWLGNDRQHWPASWTQMERLKFLSTDGTRLYKFQGFGRFGAEVHQRACVLAAGGFAVRPLAVEQGFTVYPVIDGRLLRRGDLDSSVLHRMAEYCAFRASTKRRSSSRKSDLELMLRFNTREEFGIELPDEAVRLEVAIPVITDSRMLPHKWVRTDDGILMKLDGTDHGDDHFFPGPTDIAWDLAGAIVEWQMEETGRAEFIQQYERTSGDEVGRRLPNYLLAYAVFRMGYCHMAAAAMRGSEEEPRLMHAYQQYRRRAMALLEHSGLPAGEPRIAPVVESQVNIA